MGNNAGREIAESAFGYGFSVGVVIGALLATWYFSGFTL